MPHFLLWLYVPTRLLISSRNNASIFNLSIFSNGKVNLVGAFRRFKISSSFHKRRENKGKEKWEFLPKTVFRKQLKQIFVFGTSVKKKPYTYAILL